jgi:uncharacterized protein YgbK (DUF1537 family)
MKDHPLTPMTDANLVRVLQPQTRHRVGLVPLDVIARGPQAIRARFDALQAQGTRIAVLDAVSDEDLMRIGEALAGLPLVTAGSGIAMGLPANWRASGRLGAPTTADVLPPASGHQAVVSGSCSVATLGQVQRFIEQGGAAFAIDPLALARGEALVAQALSWAQSRLGTGPVLIYASAAPEAVRAVQAQLGVAQAGELVEQALAAVARGLVERGVRQLIVAGGETSGAVVQALGVQQMSIGAQIDPGVPWTAAQARACNNVTLHLALKSGNFGTPEFFTRAFAQRVPA